jgi:hypothetical protein
MRHIRLMAITKKAIHKKYQALADLIKKGRADYPNVEHARGDWIVFDDDTGAPLKACAVGFAMLGEWDGSLNVGNLQEHTQLINEKFWYKTNDDNWYEYPTSEAIELNDSDEMSLDEIIYELETKYAE